MDAEEVQICRRRGHGWTFDEGWSQCEWCGLWLREKRAVEEREVEPAPDEKDSPKSRQRQVGKEIPLSLAELVICRRRGHSIAVGTTWSRCDFCGFWLRTNLTIEEREDEPPENEMSTGTRTDRELVRIKEHLKKTERKV